MVRPPEVANLDSGGHLALWGRKSRASVDRGSMAPRNDAAYIVCGSLGLRGSDSEVFPACIGIRAAER